MCSPRNDKCNSSFSKTLLSIKCMLCTCFYVSAEFLFAFWRAEKHVFHIAPFSPTRYELKRFRYLEVGNRVSNWNKVKTSYSWGRNFNNANWHYQYSYTNNVSEYINKLSFISVLRIYSCNELEWWQNYYFSTIIITNSPIEMLVSYSMSTNVNVKKSFPNSKFEGNFSTYVFGKSFWHYRQLKIEYWISRHL